MNNLFKRIRSAVLIGVATTSVVLVEAMPASAVDNPKPNLPDGLQGKLDTLLGMLMAIAILACVAGVLIVAILMAIAARRGTLDDHFGRLGAVMIACVLIGGASSLVTFLI